jgi:hypothetical protein
MSQRYNQVKKSICNLRIAIRLKAQSATAGDQGEKSMRLKVTKIEDGLNPSQISVSVSARDGVHYLVLSKSSIDASNTIDVANPVARRDREVLVELPTETDSGTWRLWVDKDSLTDGVLEAAE